MMFRFDARLAVYVHREAVDFRKSINGLAALVEQALGLDPFAAALYVFANRRRDRVKILCWETNGFWLLLKRLEADRFVWPRADETVIELTIEQLHWLLDGIDLDAMRAHRVVRYRRAS
jgi:transposase